VRTDRLRHEYNVGLHWTAFPLHPETPDEGLELTEIFAGRETQLKAMQERLRQVAAAEGVPLAERSRTCNSRRAQELGKWAEEQGRGEAYHQAVYHAYFVEGRNIALVDELLRIVTEFGLRSDEARHVLTAGSHAAAVDADWQRSRELGITAVPTHLFGGNSIVGFRPYEDFVRLIEKG
jgi:predicted DsbA family dithiol-disulfide isomerase